jgi:hypothetical protein
VPGPVFPGKCYVDWQLDDLAGQGVDALRPSATTSTVVSARCSPNSSPSQTELFRAQRLRMSMAASGLQLSIVDFEKVVTW